MELKGLKEKSKHPLLLKAGVLYCMGLTLLNVNLFKFSLNNI